MNPPKGNQRLTKLAPMSLGELAYRSIRDSIITNRFKAGERLVETRLAEELGISRAPVREALRRLAEERLAEERPRHGTFVRSFTADDFVNVYNVRIAIEVAAIRLVVRHKASTLTLEEIVASMEKAAARRDIDGVVDLEFRFHETLCDLAGNEFLAAMFRSASAQIRIALAMDDAEFTDVTDVVAEHRPVLAAIRAGDEVAAARSLHEHILASVGPVMNRLGDDPARLLTPLV